MTEREDQPWWMDNGQEAGVPRRRCYFPGPIIFCITVVLFAFLFALIIALGGGGSDVVHLSCGRDAKVRGTVIHLDCTNGVVDSR